MRVGPTKMEDICPHCGYKHTIKELDRDAGPYCIKCGMDMESEKEGGINSEPCHECNTSIPYGPGTKYESHPTVCPNCGVSMEEK